MTQNPEHISDVELVLAANGELSASRLAAVGRHIEACSECQTRLSAFEGAIGEYFDARREQLDPQLRALTPTPTAFQQRLAVLTAAQRWSRWLPSRRADRLAVAGACVAVVVTAFGLLLTSVAEPKRFAPDSALTPGSTRPVTVAELCGTEEPEGELEVSRAAALNVFRRHGIVNPPPGAYELDYLIPPELGGAKDDRNLWPQPYQVQPWNAHAKDALEDRLRRLVCSGSLDLQVAQQEISGDWTVAYRKYFDTSEPLLSHASFLKDSPWE